MELKYGSVNTVAIEVRENENTHLYNPKPLNANKLNFIDIKSTSPNIKNCILYLFQNEMK